MTRLVMPNGDHRNKFIYPTFTLLIYSYEFLSTFLIKSQDGPLYILMGYRQVILSKTIKFLSLKIDFVLANSVDLDEISHYASGSSLFA